MEELGRVNGLPLAVETGITCAAALFPYIGACRPLLRRHYITKSAGSPPPVARRKSQAIEALSAAFDKPVN